MAKEAEVKAERERTNPLGAVPQLLELHQAFGGRISFDDFYRGRQLTVHPLATATEVASGEEKLGLILTVPVPGRGLRLIAVSKLEHPKLYDALMEGFFVPRGEETAAPVHFACFLDDPPLALAPSAGAHASAELVVNPSLRFVSRPGHPYYPYDVAARTAFWQTADCLVPGYPMAWLEDPATRVLSAYWLRGRWRELVARLSPGAPAPALDPQAIELLLRAHVLLPRGGFEAEKAAFEERSAAAREELRARGYTILRQILHPFQVAALRHYYRRLVGEGHLPLGDPQVPKRYIAHNEPMARYFHGQLTELMSRVIGEPRQPSYCYTACYQPGAVLRRHTDREQCEVSASFLVDYRPETTREEAWPLYLQPGDEPLPIRLGVGDALLYRGADIPHWRDALPEGHSSTSIFMHYVPLDFKGPLD